jgi:uncharacterized membrane protein
VAILGRGFYQTYLGPLLAVDILWGVVLCAVVASAGFFLGRWLRGGG